MKYWAWILLLLLTLPAQAAWYDNAWDYRFSITTNADVINADLTDFPVYLDLNGAPSEFFTNVDANGADIRMTKNDGTTEVAREIVWMDTANGIGELHFIADGTLSSSSDSTFYIYYGNSSATEPAADSTYGSENVWTNYTAVWHFQDPPTSTMPDSAENGYDLTTFGSLTAGDSVAGQLTGNGVDFDYSESDYMSNSSMRRGANTGTMSFWLNMKSGFNRYGIMLVGANSPNVAFRVVLFDGNIFFQNGPSSSSWVNPSSPGLSNWYYYSARYEIGGSPTLALTIDSTTFTDTDSLSSVTSNGVTIANTDWFLNGTMDEVRFSDMRFSDGYATTEYNNQSSPTTFYEYGAQEENPDAGGGNAMFFGVSF